MITDAFIGENLIFRNWSDLLVVQMTDDHENFRYKLGTQIFDVECPAGGIAEVHLNNRLKIGNIFNIDTRYENKFRIEKILEFPSVDFCEDLSETFAYLQTVKEINLNNFNTHKATNMYSMFKECCYLDSIDLNSFNTENVTTMKCMFMGCTYTQFINVSSFNTEHVNNMFRMFSYCYFLPELNVTSFNTEKVNDMGFMFSQCTKLETLDLSSFNTENVIDISYMFYQCSKLKSLKLGNFNLRSVTDSEEMFNKCYELTDITGSVSNIKTDLSLTDCPLTRDSALLFLNGVVDVGEKRTLSFKNTTYSLLQEEDLALATSKGWTITS